MNYKDAMHALDDAFETLDNGDLILRMTARRMVGRLRQLNLDSDTLIKLKRELTKFNSHTREWRG